ncbi:spidroin 3B variant 1, partial [Trichonephila inaurata madagascariensis]
MGVHSKDNASFSRNVKFADGAGMKRRNGVIFVDEDENGINAKFEDINGKSDMERLRDNNDLDTIFQTGIGDGFQSNGKDHIPIGPDDSIDKSSDRPRKIITFRSNGELDDTGPKFKSSLENFGQKDSKKTGNYTDLESGNNNRHGSGDISGGLGLSQAVKFQADKKESGIRPNRKDNPGKGFKTAGETRLGQGVGGNLAIKTKLISKVITMLEKVLLIVSVHKLKRTMDMKMENEHGKKFGSQEKPDLGVNFDTSRNSRKGKYTFQGNGAHFDNGHGMNSPRIKRTQTQKEDGHVREHMVNSLALGKHAEFGYNGELVDNSQSDKDNYRKKNAFKDKTHLGQSENLGVKLDTVRNTRIRKNAISESGTDFEGNTGNGMISHQSISIQAENVNEHEIKDIFDSFGLGKLTELAHEGEIVDSGKNNKDGSGKKFGRRDENDISRNSHVRNDAILKRGANFEGNNAKGMTSHHSISVQAGNVNEHEIKDIFDSSGHGKRTELGHESKLVHNGKNNKKSDAKKFGGTDEIDISRNSHVRNDAILESGANFEGNNDNGMASHHSISIEAENVNEHEIKDIFDSFGLGTLTEFGQEGKLIYNGKNNKKFGSRDKTDISRNSHVENDAILESGTDFEGNNDNGMTSHHSISVEAENVNEHEIKDSFDSSLGSFDSSVHGKATQFGHEGVDNGKNNKYGNRKKFGRTDEIDISRNSHVRNDAILESGANFEGNNDNGMSGTDFEGNNDNGMTSHHSISVEAENVNEHEIKDSFDSSGHGKLTQFGHEGVDNGKNNKYGNRKKFGRTDEIDISRNSHVRNDAVLESGANFEGNNDKNWKNIKTSHHSISVEAENVNEMKLK